MDGRDFISKATALEWLGIKKDKWAVCMNYEAGRFEKVLRRKKIERLR